ncbi:MAG: hypothetical protein IT500_13570 [Rubrivivax sp.]|nr:hypothetical protein [Rubrivivax sp.]
MRRLVRLLARCGALVQEDGAMYLAGPAEHGDDEASPAQAMCQLQAAACTHRIAFGPVQAASCSPCAAPNRPTNSAAAGRCVPRPTTSTRTPACAAPRQAIAAEDGRFEATPEPERRSGIPWAKWLARVFKLDLEQCPNCGGGLRMVAAILERAAIERILGHLKLRSQAPPRLPALDEGAMLTTRVAGWRAKCRSRTSRATR